MTKSEKSHRPLEANFTDAILQSISDGVFTVDTHWRITSFNRAAEEITGIKRREAMGRICSEVFRCSMCETECALRQTMQSGKPIIGKSGYIIGADGHRLPISVSTAVLKDDNGNVVGGAETFRDLSEVEALRRELEGRTQIGDLVSRSPLMQRVFEVLPAIAGSPSTVLICGETGTGKELMARTIHSLSHHRKGPFVAVSCGALPDTLLESELFGYKAGAFTGARQDKPGRFALAQGGTILLDEIGDISPAMQVRLLRVLQEKRIEPLGSIQPVKIDVRVVAATNQNLEELVREKRFRKDLFYRIRVVQLQLPDLQQRRMDIPILVDHMVAKFNRLKDKNIAGVTEEVLLRLMAHDYPGNVRELENIIEHAFVLCPGGLIEMHHLPPELCAASTLAGGHFIETRTLKAMEKIMICETLRRHRGNRSLAARDLGIDASTLYRKIRELKITPPSTDGRSGSKRGTD